MLHIAVCDDNIDELSNIVRLINLYRASRNLNCEYAVFTNGFELTSTLEKVCNSYQIEPIFIQGLPVSREQGHGLGLKIMAHIVEKRGGVYRFAVEDGWFIFQATA